VHKEWTDQLSDYLDDELSGAERDAVEQHLQGCADCRVVLNDVKRVVAEAQSMPPRPPKADLWAGIAGQITGTGLGVEHRPRPVPFRLTFTMPQLAVAAVMLVAVSAGLAWRIADGAAQARSAAMVAQGAAPPGDNQSGVAAAVAASERDASLNPSIVQVAYADAQYDAAVADLEGALRLGRGRLDASTIAVVEHNLQIIDQAIAQAREALASDPANSYLSGHLVDARRRKLDLLRRATELTSETN
jgi:hypothetical protein